MADRLGKGLQNLLKQFNSAPDLIESCRGDGMVYVEDLKSSDRKVVWVRVPPAAQEFWWDEKGVSRIRASEYSMCSAQAPRRSAEESHPRHTYVVLNHIFLQLMNTSLVSIPATPMRFLRFVSRPFLRYALATFFFVTIAQTLALTLPYVLKLLIDALTQASDTLSLSNALLRFGALYTGILTLMFIGWRASGFCGIRWLTESKAYSFRVLYDYIALHSHTYFSNRFAGAIANKISHASDGADKLMEDLVWHYYPSLLSLFGTAILLFLTDVRLAGVFVLLVIVLVTINILLVRRRRPLVVAYAEASSVLRGVGVDLVTNMSSVRQFDRRVFEQDRLAQYIDDRTHKDKARGWSQEFGLLLNNTLVVIAIIVMMLILVRGVMTGVFSAGDVVLVVSLIWSTSYQLIFIGNMLNGFIRVYSEIEEGLTETLVAHDIVDTPGARSLIVPTGRIVWQDVVFRYDTNTVLDHFNLDILPGERLGLVGPSGAGKSTFVSLLLRQHELSGGTIQIDNQDISGVTQDSLRMMIAVVPQEPALFHRSIRENIAYGKPDATQEEIEAVAKKAQAHEFIIALPDGYETLVGERGVKLSGGQRQRVVIARAMLKDAPILVLDEATSALDSESEVAIQQALHELMAGKTVIAIAHRLSTLREMDRIIVLEKGVIVEDGTHETLLAGRGSYARLWEHQAGGFLQE